MFSCLCSPPTNVVAKSNVTLLYPGSGAGPWPGGPPELLGQHTGLRGRSVPHIRPELSDAVGGGCLHWEPQALLLYPLTFIPTHSASHTPTPTHRHSHTFLSCLVHPHTLTCTHKADTQGHRQMHTQADTHLLTDRHRSSQADIHIQTHSSSTLTATSILLGATV